MLGGILSPICQKNRDFSLLMCNCGKRASSFHQARVDHLLTAEHGEEEVPEEWHALPGKDLKMNSLKGKNQRLEKPVFLMVQVVFLSKRKADLLCKYLCRLLREKKRSGATKESRDKHLKNSTKRQSEKRIQSNAIVVR